MVGNFRQKKLFRGRRNRENNWFVPAEFRLFRGGEKCSELYTYHRTKIEANSWNSVLNHSADEKLTRNFVPWNKKRSKQLEFCSEPFRGRENNSEFRSVEQKKKQTLGIQFRSCLGQKHFFMSFPPVPSLGIDSFVTLGMSTFLRGIEETIPSLFRGIFSERNSVANPRERENSGGGGG
jgi:hypothetical protein